MTECDNCGAPMTELEKIITKEVDEETREVLGVRGEFCSIACGESYVGGDT